MTESNNRQDSVRHYIKRDTAQARAYSQAVVTKGGRVVWLAGQVREVFSRLGQTLERILASATIRLASAVSSAKKQHSCREGPMVRIQLPPAVSPVRTWLSGFAKLEPSRLRLIDACQGNPKPRTAQPLFSW
jgi:hypothetical protein